MGKFLRRKLSVLLLISTSAVAFATLGDGKKSSDVPKKSNLLSARTTSSGNFSLRSGYTYRGSSVFNNNTEKRYISINTTVTMHKGNTTYIVPLRKKVVLSNVKIDLSNRSLKRN
jgi:hypothetical protein